MKARDWSDVELTGRRAQITAPATLRAFDMLVNYGVSSPKWAAGPGRHGHIKDFNFKAEREWPFSFITNRGHLLFYLRAAGVRGLGATKAALVKWFAEVKEGGGGELTVRVKTESEAGQVISQILEKWSTARGSTAGDRPRDSTVAEQGPSSPSKSNWSRLEVEATVADYFAMLLLELTGQPYNKAAHNRSLQKLLNNRSQAAVELKHQNISAILLELGCVYITGYKPRGNYQGLLQEVVSARIETDGAFQAAATTAVERAAPPMPVTDFRDVRVNPPRVNRISDTSAARAYTRRPIRCDYLARDERNRSLGFAGELFIADFEARRLHAGGHVGLSKRVEHVANTQGDGLGYDVLSFEPSGQERFIEVKTTSFGPLTPFFVSRNELRFSEESAMKFVLARVHEFRVSPKFFELKGPIRKNLRLEPVTYEARL